MTTTQVPKITTLHSNNSKVGPYSNKPRLNNVTLDWTPTNVLIKVNGIVMQNLTTSSGFVPKVATRLLYIVRPTNLNVKDTRDSVLYIKSYKFTPYIVKK